VLLPEEEWRPVVFGVEAISFQKTIQPIVIDQAITQARRIPTIHQVTKADIANKEFRIKRIAPRCRMGQIWLPVGDRTKPYDYTHQRHYCAHGIRHLISQGQKFPRGKDDILDALCQVIDLPLVPAAMEKPKSDKSWGERILEAELERQGMFEDQYIDATLGSVM